MNSAGSAQLAAFYVNGVNTLVTNFQGGVSLQLGGGEVYANNVFHAQGTIKSDNGYACKSGNAGATSGNVFNFFWTGGAMQMWVDGTNNGTVNTTSDYRTKKDVTDLPGAWDEVKALRPIKYTQAEFSPPSHLEYIADELAKARKEAEDNPDAAPREVNTAPLYTADDIERRGFIAHELQETLGESAATGVKDSPDTVQSPNPWTVIATLTKALQEAMARIEALEAA
jgi:hypothetical protein